MKNEMSFYNFFILYLFVTCLLHWVVRPDDVNYPSERLLTHVSKSHIQAKSGSGNRNNDFEDETRSP